MTWSHLRSEGPFLSTGVAVALGLQRQPTMIRTSKRLMPGLELAVRRDPDDERVDQAAAFACPRDYESPARRWRSPAGRRAGPVRRPLRDRAGSGVTGEVPTSRRRDQSLRRAAAVVEARGPSRRQVAGESAGRKQRGQAGRQGRRRRGGRWRRAGSRAAASAAPLAIRSSAYAFVPRIRNLLSKRLNVLARAAEAACAR